MWNSIVSVWVEFPPYSWPGLPWPGSESCTELFIHPGCTAEGRASCQLVGAEQLISVVQQLAGNCCSKFSYSSELLFQIKKKVRIILVFIYLLKVIFFKACYGVAPGRCSSQQVQLGDPKSRVAV